MHWSATGLVVACAAAHNNLLVSVLAHSALYTASATCFSTLILRSRTDFLAGRVVVRAGEDTNLFVNLLASGACGAIAAAVTLATHPTR